MFSRKKLKNLRKKYYFIAKCDGQERSKCPCDLKQATAAACHRSFCFRIFRCFLRAAGTLPDENTCGVSAATTECMLTVHKVQCASRSVNGRRQSLLTVHKVQCASRSVHVPEVSLFGALRNISLPVGLVVRHAVRQSQCTRTRGLSFRCTAKHLAASRPSRKTSRCQ
jgi:hypothetical protein